MPNRSGYTRLDIGIKGPTWNTMSDILLEKLKSGGGGGVAIFGGGGVAKRGVRPNPPPPRTPSGYGPEVPGCRRQMSPKALIGVVCGLL